MLADKQRAVAESSPRRRHAHRRPQRDAAERMARRLQALAQENRRLLERAIAVQGRVIGVDRACRGAVGGAAGYGAAARPHRPRWRLAA